VLIIGVAEELRNRSCPEGAIKNIWNRYMQYNREYVGWKLKSRTKKTEDLQSIQKKFCVHVYFLQKILFNRNSSWLSTTGSLLSQIWTQKQQSIHKLNSRSPLQKNYSRQKVLYKRQPQLCETKTLIHLWQNCWEDCHRQHSKKGTQKRWSETRRAGDGQGKRKIRGMDYISISKLKNTSQSWIENLCVSGHKHCGSGNWPLVSIIASVAQITGLMGCWMLQPVDISRI